MATCRESRATGAPEPASILSPAWPSGSGSTSAEPSPISRCRPRTDVSSPANASRPRTTRRGRAWTGSVSWSPTPGSAWADLAQAVHGTTLGSNLVIERKGGNVALLTTRGFRDVLDHRPGEALPALRPPHREAGAAGPPLAHSRGHRADGVRRRGAGAARRGGPASDGAGPRDGRGSESIAICFLHSYANPAHERRAAEIVHEEAPHVAVSLSSEISPVIREYERTSTTVVNAYVMTEVRDYLERLEEALRGARVSRAALRHAVRRAASRPPRRWPGSRFA